VSIPSSALFPIDTWTVSSKGGLLLVSRSFIVFMIRILGFADEKVKIC